MSQADEHSKNAIERERLTKAAITEGHRRMILQIAETWRLLAEQRGVGAERRHEAKRV